ncbi:MAG: BMP family ABC transporter substrate-binding protein [Lachnospiraceae bacterium]|nr:BMP family ABC transporter substrate-binding protein [Lachnospiraceae bacterium]
MNKNSSKRILIIAVVILAAVILGMVLIRDRGEVETDVTADTTKVGLVISGAKDDSNYCQTHYDALMRIKDELNLEIVCREHTPEEEEQYTRAIEELIGDEGCRIIIAASFGYHLAEIAAKYPEVCFIHIFGSEVLSNLSSPSGRMYQARYLSGIAAAKRSQTGKIGYVAAFPNSEVICQINAFALGAGSVTPETEVFVRYCGSWVDNDAARAAAEELLLRQPDIDVFSMHTNSLEPNRVAEETGIWSVGFNYDNRELFPKSYLTACEWKWDPYYREAILSYLQGKFSGEITWFDMDSGILGLSELTENAASGTKEAVDEATKRFNSGSFDVFYGPVTDNQGVRRVEEGEAMPDDEILHGFDWYVEGVKVEE